MSTERDEALDFLKQDPLGNANLIAQLLHTAPLRVNVVRDEQGTVAGVILIEPLIEGEQVDVLVQLDGRGAEEVPGLLRFLRGSDLVRLEVHRAWMQALFDQSPNWRPNGGVIHTFALPAQVDLPPLDANVVQLTPRHASQMATEPLSWAPSILRRYLQEGRRAFAYQFQGRLVTRAVSGMPTPYTEEITAIYTTPTHRSRGFGRAVVNAMAHDIRAWNRIPTYVTTADNEPSLQLVRKLNFKLISTARVYERLNNKGL